MAKRTICIQNPSKISVKNKCLKIESENEIKAQIPFEDIWVIIIETHLATISSSALSAISESGIGLLVCGKNHMPNGLLLPLGSHSRHASIVKNQLNISKPLAKQLWQLIVKQKIENQAAVLDLLKMKSSDLKAIATEVLSGDTSNREGVAASKYFKRLCPDGGRRESLYTPSLDYGYSVLRAGIGRAATSGGWLVSQGLHHCNELNAFNLVDDLIEPFRPVVDLMVFTLNIQGDLTPQSKMQLARIFEVMVQVDGKKETLQHAIEIIIETLKSSVINKRSASLSLPKIIKLEYSQGE